MAPIPAQPPSLKRLDPAFLAGPVKKLAYWETIPVVPRGFRILREGSTYSEAFEPWPEGEGTRLYANVLGHGNCRLWSPAEK